MHIESILILREQIEKKCHFGLRELFSEHVFVGCVSVDKALIQHNTKLYLCNTNKLCRELFYQLIVYNMNNFGTITFKEPLSLYKILIISLELPHYPICVDKERKARSLTDLLVFHAHLLREHFSIEINPEGELLSIPLLLENHTPEMAGLPLYILKLAIKVNFETETNCLNNIALETAIYYAQINKANHIENLNWKWTTEHVLYPTIKKHFIPPDHFTENVSIIEIADLPNLYKVFERC